MKKWSWKDVLKMLLYFVLYVALTYVAMFPGYQSAIYWILFPIVASFLISGPLTCAMNLKRQPLTAILLPLLFFGLAKIIGEMTYAVCWIPFLCVIVAAEVVRDLVGFDKLLSIRIAVPIAALSIAMWNNGFYFGGQVYKDAVFAEMGEAYATAAYRMVSPITYIAILVGVAAMAVLGERLTEKIFKIKND